jgi:hypothetical protein
VLHALIEDFRSETLASERGGAALGVAVFLQRVVVLCIIAIVWLAFSLVVWAVWAFARFGNVPPGGWLGFLLTFGSCMVVSTTFALLAPAMLRMASRLRSPRASVNLYRALEALAEKRADDLLGSGIELAEDLDQKLQALAKKMAEDNETYRDAIQLLHQIAEARGKSIPNDALDSEDL